MQFWSSACIFMLYLRKSHYKHTRNSRVGQVSVAMNKVMSRYLHKLHLKKPVLRPERLNPLATSHIINNELSRGLILRANCGSTTSSAAKKDWLSDEIGPNMQAPNVAGMKTLGLVLGLEN